MDEDELVIVDELDLNEFTANNEEDDVLEIQDTELEYPCMVLEGVLTSWEMDFLLDMKTDENASLPLYVLYSGMLLDAGKIELSSDCLIAIDYMDVNKQYKLKLYKSKNNVVDVNIHDGATLEKLIKL